MHISQRLFLKGGGRAAQKIARRQGGTNNTKNRSQETVPRTSRVLGWALDLQHIFSGIPRTSQFWDGPWICIFFSGIQVLYSKNLPVLGWALDLHISNIQEPPGFGMVLGFFKTTKYFQGQLPIPCFLVICLNSHRIELRHSRCKICSCVFLSQTLFPCRRRSSRRKST